MTTASKLTRRAATAVAFFTCFATSGNAQMIKDDEIEMSPISGSVDNPRRHFRLKNAESMDPEEAEQIYAIVRTALADGYGASGIRPAIDYQGWRKYNTAPYPSATHGNHYLSNYANPQAYRLSESP